jgi:hypothetical protein
MSATDIQSCHSNPPVESCVPMRRTSGASAMSGTVWLSTTHGRSADCAVRKRCMTIAIAMPTTTPTSHPTTAMPKLNDAACSVASHRAGEPAARVTGDRVRSSIAPR